MEYYKGDIPIIDFDGPANDVSHPADVSFGMVPRDYGKYPEAMFSPPDQMQVIPESEWDARYDEQEATKSSLEHIYLGGPNGAPRFVNLDQGGDGYCWSYSVGHSIMLDRLKANLPVVRLNPHADAAIIKGGRDEGGWCGLSAEWGRKNGYAVEGTGPGQWPKQSRDLRYDTPELRKQMLLHRIEEDWVDLTRQVYDQKLTTLQLATCGFNNNPAPSDFNWWSHSVCQVRWVRIEKGSWGPLILNSWLNWGRYGLGVLRGTKGIANGAVATRMTTASAN